MATIKSYTDIEQSKKLAEILSTSSADMIYIMYRNGKKPQNGDENLSTVYEDDEHKWYWIDIIDESWNMRIGKDIPCWSLSALLNILPKNIKLSDGVINPFIGQVDNRDYRCVYLNGDWNANMQTFGNNPVDACYEMILKLHELKLL